MIPRNPSHAYTLGLYTGRLEQLANEPCGRNVALGEESACLSDDRKTFLVWEHEKQRYRVYRTAKGAAWFCLRRAIAREVTPCAA